MSSDHQPKVATIRFGSFEANLETQELRKCGIRLRLPAQSFQILRLLLERPGSLVTREELQQALWPSDTFVDFDHGLHAAVNRLRDALGDSAESPGLIENLPRRGYRFIGKIEVPPVSTSRNYRRSWFRAAVWAVASVGLAVLIAFAYLVIRYPMKPAPFAPIPFTAYPGMEFAPTFSPDGSQIAFAWDGDSGSGSTGFDLYVKVIGSEDLLRLTRQPSEWISPAWSPDGTQIAFHRISGEDTGIYVIPALGGPERKLRSTHIVNKFQAPISWSPDEEWIAFADGLSATDPVKLHLLDVKTHETKEIQHAEVCVNESLPAFSHNGKALAYGCRLSSGRDARTEIVTGTFSTSASSVLSDEVSRKQELFGMAEWAEPTNIAWTADDSRIIVAHPRYEMGAGGDTLDEISIADGSTNTLSLGQDALWPAISTRGNRLAYVTFSRHVDIWRKDLANPQIPAVRLLASTQQQKHAEYSPDGKHIAFESTRGGAREVWMSDADGAHVIQISSFGHRVTGTPRWSPDGRKIVFDSPQSGHGELYTVDISERTPRKVITNVSDLSVPSWSRDGEWLYFTSTSAPSAGIYRCPARGGKAILLSAFSVNEPKANALESFDGTTIYFGSGRYFQVLKALSLSPGHEEVSLRLPLVDDADVWTVVPGGIYFVPADSNKSLQYFDFNSKKVQQVFEVNTRFVGGLSVSPDGRWILYSQAGETNADIMLVEHFRP